jgi:hypothetical protein
MKPGTRLKSATCDTEVVIIRCNAEQIDCGGQAMAEAIDSKSDAPHPDFASGTVMGKRYVTADNGVELLCVKPGKGSLSIAGTPLNLKEAKPLPASD